MPNSLQSILDVAALPEFELAAAAAAAPLSSVEEIPIGLTLSINASPSVVLTKPFQDLLWSAPLSRIVLEITEYDEVADYAALSDATEPLRRAGLRLGIDDAGAGYASFQHVLQLRPDLIKIDLSIVRNVDFDPARRALVTAFAAQGYLLGRPTKLTDALSGRIDM